MKNTYTLFILFSVLVISTTLISCVSIGSNNNDLDQKESQNKTLFLEIDKPSFISEDNLYGNFVFEITEITKDIAANGTLIAYLERPAGENNPQRWSQFPQYCLACNEEEQAPSFTYFSYGEGIIRISMQSKTDVRPMAEVLKGKKIKITIIN
ncbi:hypothetical protein OA331_03475 [Bacteroidota bacterium]|nr:hypothetical protein [Bacteroidota bacterium]